jgi:hypothetical protein
MCPSTPARSSILTFIFVDVEVDVAVSGSEPRPISSTTLDGSAAPINGISEARNCWNGFATKRPSAVNHRVNGASTLNSFHCVCGVV